MTNTNYAKCVNPNILADYFNIKRLESVRQLAYFAVQSL